MRSSNYSGKYVASPSYLSLDQSRPERLDKESRFQVVWNEKGLTV